MAFVWRGGFRSGVTALGLQLAGAAKAQAEAAALSEWCARGLSAGRSEVETHLGVAGAALSARTTEQADGSFQCQASGLRKASAGELVHEVTKSPIAGSARRWRRCAATTTARQGRPPNGGGY